MRDPRGPQITTALSFSADPSTAYVREMETADLHTALNDWTRWKSVHGRGRHEGAVEFKREANRQLGRIRRELKRREKERESSSIDPDIRALLDATGRCTFEHRGTMYNNPYSREVQ